MLFRTENARVIAISQLAHAWIAGHLMRAWDEKLSEPLLLAAEQHDLGWIDWEVAPSFDASTGRPHLFRDVGAATHAPTWARGVDRALAAWGAHVALLVSRHGALIYRRYASRHQRAPEDAAASITISRLKRSSRRPGRPARLRRGAIDARIRPHRLRRRALAVAVPRACSQA